MENSALEIEDHLKRDFRNTLFYVWKCLSIGKDPTDIQYDLAEYLQNGPNRKIIMGFRGVGKTWIFCSYVVWRLYVNPDLKILVISATKVMATEIVSFIRRILDACPAFADMVPKLGDLDSATAFNLGNLTKESKSPSVKSAGISGQITGNRADVILADDVEAASNSFTQVQRQQLISRVTEFDAIVVPGGEITYLGTPQSYETIYTLLQDRGYVARVWPARVPADVAPYRGNLAPFVQNLIEEGLPAGTPTDPKRFSEDDLASRERAFGPSGFSLQFMLDTTLHDQDLYPLKLGDLMVYEFDMDHCPSKFVWGGDPITDGSLPDCGMPGDTWRKPMYVNTTDPPVPWQVRKMAIDPSGRGADESGYAIIFGCNAYLALIESGGFKDGFSDRTMAKFCELIIKYKITQCTVESNFGDGMFTKLLGVAFNMHGVKCEIVEVRSMTQKENRIADEIQPLCGMHKLLVNLSAIRKDIDETQLDPQRGLWYQFTRLARVKGALVHDDRIDALALACQSMRDFSGRNSESLIEAARMKRLDEEIKGIHNSLRKASGKPEPTWIRREQ